MEALKLLFIFYVTYTILYHVGERLRDKGVVKYSKYNRILLVSSALFYVVALVSFYNTEQIRESWFAVIGAILVSILFAIEILSLRHERYIISMINIDNIRNGNYGEIKIVRYKMMPYLRISDKDDDKVMIFLDTKDIKLLQLANLVQKDDLDLENEKENNNDKNQ